MSHRLSRPKMHRLAQVIVETIKKQPGVKMTLGEKELRWKIFTWIQQILQLDEAIDQRVKARIRKSRRVPEGSSEWQILYRQYYEEELQGLSKYRR